MNQLPTMPRYPQPHCSVQVRLFMWALQFHGLAYRGFAALSNYEAIMKQMRAAVNFLPDGSLH